MTIPYYTHLRHVMRGKDDKFLRRDQNGFVRVSKGILNTRAHFEQLSPLLSVGKTHTRARFNPNTLVAPE